MNAGIKCEGQLTRASISLLKNLLSGQLCGAQEAGLPGCSISEFFIQVYHGAALSQNCTGQEDLLLGSRRRQVALGEGGFSCLLMSRFSVSQHVSPFLGLASPEPQRSGPL